MRALLLFLLWPGFARADDLERLYDRIAADLRRNRPLTVHVDVALCDNSIISCGGHGLGDGDDPARNLYWASSGGLRGWFERPGSGWRRVSLAERPEERIGESSGARRGASGEAVPSPMPESIVERVVYTRSVEPNDFWRARGIERPFVVRVDATGWRGRAIESALESFAARATQGGAHIAAYVGHNGWMDVDRFAWPPPGPEPAGAIAIACLTRSYLQSVVPLPLLLTSDLLFAGSHALDGALQAITRGGSLATIRDAAARAYADGEGKSFARVRGAFTNASDRRY
jgi:hypothetical protein